MTAQDNRDTQDAPAPDASLADLLGVFRRAIELDLRVAMPAEVVSYDPATQRVRVKLGLLPVPYGPDGEEADPSAAIEIPEVRVQWFGASGAWIKGNLEAGDTGKVTFTDRCLGEWLRQGKPVDPNNGRTHALGDAIFEPGLRHDNNVIDDDTNDALVLESETIRLGVDADEAAVLGDSFMSLFNDVVGVLNNLITDHNLLVSTYNGHTHPYVDTPAGAAVTSATTSTGSPFNETADQMTEADHLSGKVFVDGGSP